jgi:hypothetical protein
MSLEEPDDLLTFNARRMALQVEHPRARLYAFIDPGFLALPDSIEELLKEVERYPLYAGSGLNSLTQSGPYVIACPLSLDERIGRYAGAANLIRSLWALARTDNRLVSWVWSTHDIESLIEHWQTLLHAKIGPDEEDAWFHFYMPSYLPVLHRALPDETRHYMFGPCVAWWCQTSEGELIELPGGNSPIPPACDALPIPESVVAALHRESAPQQTRIWLYQQMPELFTSAYPSHQIRQLQPFVERAFQYGITDKVNLGVYAAVGLKYGIDYDAHPAINEVLLSFRPGETSLIDQYAAIDSAVWREVQETVDTRARAHAVRLYHAELNERGYLELPTRIRNGAGMCDRYRIEMIDLASNSSVELGAVQGLSFRDVEVEVGTVRIPLPGGKVRIRWGEHYDRPFFDTEVHGDLPLAPKTAYALVKFGYQRSAFVYIRPIEPLEKLADRKKV